MAQDNYNPGQEGATVTAAPNLQTVQARYDPNADVNSLLKSLGSESTQQALGNFKAEYEQRKLQEQGMKIEGYTQQFMQDHQGGAVSQAQLKERFPEMVPVIAARVSEAIGRKQGTLDIAKTIEHINNTDSLRLDSAARAAYVATKRQELFDAVPKGNDFYAAGVVGAMDRSFLEQEGKWQSQTAAYHGQVQSDALLGEAVTALGSADPKAAMALIDTNYGQSSSLNRVERNKIYVDAVIKLASTSDNPAILDKIPQAYLNVDSKAQIRTAGIAITNQQWAQFTRGKEFEQYQREEVDRKGKLEILSVMAKNGDVDPAKYLNSPALHAFAVVAMTTPKMPEAASQAAVQAFTQSLYANSNIMSLGSLNDLTKAAMGLNINPKDKADLVAALPKIMEGKVLMNDPAIQEAYKNHIGFRLDDMAKATEPRIQLMMNGTNIRGKSMILFEGEIRGSFEAWFKKTGAWPVGTDARLIIKEAVTTTSTYIDNHSSLKALTNMTPGAAAPAATPQASPAKPAAPVGSPGLPKGVSIAK